VTYFTTHQKIEVQTSSGNGEEMHDGAMIECLGLQ